MLSSQAKQFLVSAISNEAIADDIEKRLAFQAVSNYEVSIDEIREYLTVALANANFGDLLADKLEQAAAVKYADENGDVAEVPAVAATFVGAVAGVTGDVDISADVAGVAGNVTIALNGTDTLSDIIDAYNLGAEADEQVTLNSANGGDTPDAGSIELSGGADLIPASNPDLATAKAAFDDSDLSDAFMENLVVAVCDESAADEIKAMHDELVETIDALS
jgi:hypothetical protein